MFKNTFQSDSNRNGRQDYIIEGTLQQSQEIYKNLKQIFDMRVDQYEQTIKQVCDRLLNDQLIDTLKKDKTSIEFVHIRIKEIIKECQDEDKESVIEKISIQYAKMKSDYQLLDEAYNQLQTQQEDLKIEYSQNIQTYQNQVQILENDIDRYKKQLDINNQTQSNKSQNLEQIIENKANIINELQRQIVENAYNQQKQLNQIGNQEQDGVRNSSYMKNSQQLIDYQEIMQKDLEIQNIKIQLTELQQKLNQQISVFSTQEEELSEIKRINRQLQEENKKLSLQTQQTTNSAVSAENRYKKEIESTKHTLLQQLQETSEKLKQLRQKYKQKTKSLKQRVEEYKIRIQEIEEESLLQREQQKNDKRNLVEQIEIMQSQYDYELQAKHTELANTLQANNSNFEEQRLKMRQELNDQLEKQLKSMKQTYEQDISKMKKREQETHRKYEEQIQNLVIQNKQVQNNFYQTNDYTTVKFENEKLKQELISLKTEHQFIQNQYNYNLQNQSAKNDGLEEQIVTHKKQHQTLQKEQIGKQEIEIQKMKKQYDHLKSDADCKINQSMKQKKYLKIILAVNQKVGVLQRERDLAVQEKRQTQKQVEMLEKERNESSRKYEMKKEESKNTYTMYERTSEKLSFIEQELSQCKNERDSLQQNAYQQINDTKIENVKLEKENEQYKMQIELLNEQKKEQTNRINSIREENLQLNQKLLALVQHNSSHTQENSTTISQLQIDLKNYSIQLQDKVSKLENLRQEIQDLKINEEVRKRQITSLEESTLEYKQIIRQKDDQINSAGQALDIYKQRFAQCKIKLREAFIQILDSIRLEQESLKIQFTRSLCGLKESYEETIYQLQMRCQGYISDFKASQNDKQYFIEQINDYKQQLINQGGQHTERQKQEMEKFQSSQDKNIQVIKDMRAEMSELKKKNSSQFIQINQSNERIIELQMDIKKCKIEKERLQETIDSLNEDVKQLQQDNQEKTDKINHWRSQQQMSNTLEIERLQKLCQSEINVYQEKIIQMQRRQEMMMDFYNQQLKTIQNDYATLAKKNMAYL